MWRIDVAWDGEHLYLADALDWRLTDDPAEAQTWPSRPQAVREANAFARANVWRIEYGGAVIVPVPPADRQEPAAWDHFPRPSPN